MKRKQKKSFWEMSAKERDADVKRYDKPIDLAKTRPLTKEELAQWNRMRKGPVYSIHVYSGKVKALTVRLDAELIKWSTRYAKEHRMTRDQLITKSLLAARSFAQYQ